MTYSAAPRFEKLADVDRYVEEHGLDDLRRLIDERSIHPNCRRIATLWCWERAPEAAAREVIAHPHPWSRWVVPVLALIGIAVTVAFGEV